MKNLNNLNSYFENQDAWDLEEPIIGHEKRFANKLKRNQPKRKLNWIPISVAASLLLGFGILFFNYSTTKKVEVAFSPLVQQTHDSISSIINTELLTLKEKETPQSKALIVDALKQMNSLESDYEKLKLEIVKNGENKQIVYAMITNMQTRISFIKSVLDQVENVNKLKVDTNENHI
jgi:hypothetical protein